MYTRLRTDQKSVQVQISTVPNLPTSRCSRVMLPPSPSEEIEPLFLTVAPQKLHMKSLEFMAESKFATSTCSCRLATLSTHSKSKSKSY